MDLLLSLAAQRDVSFFYMSPRKSEKTRIRLPSRSAVDVGRGVVQPSSIPPVRDIENGQRKATGGVMTEDTAFDAANALLRSLRPKGAGVLIQFATQRRDRSVMRAAPAGSRRMRQPP